MVFIISMVSTNFQCLQRIILLIIKTTINSIETIFYDWYKTWTKGKTDVLFEFVFGLKEVKPVAEDLITREMRDKCFLKRKWEKIYWFLLLRMKLRKTKIRLNLYKYWHNTRDQSIIEWNKSVHQLLKVMITSCDTLPPRAVHSSESEVADQNSSFVLTVFQILSAFSP